MSGYQDEFEDDYSDAPAPVETLDFSALPISVLKRYRRRMAIPLGAEQQSNGRMTATGRRGLTGSLQQQQQQQQYQQQQAGSQSPLQQSQQHQLRQPMIRLPDDFQLCTGSSVNLIHPTPSPMLMPQPQSLGELHEQKQEHISEDANIIEGSTEYQELVDACNQHYQQLEIGEKDVIPWFIYAVRNQGKVLKIKPNPPRLST